VQQVKQLTSHETPDSFYTEVAAWQDRNHKDLAIPFWWGRINILQVGFN